MLRLDELGPALRAARHYRPGQLFAFGADQALRQIERLSPFGLHQLPARAGLGRPTPDIDLLAAWGSAPWFRQTSPPWRPLEHGNPYLGSYKFCGLRRDGLEPEARCPEDVPALWSYKFHYFDVIAAGVIAEGPEVWADWLKRKLQAHWANERPGRGVAWHPYPLARRLHSLLRIRASLEVDTGDWSALSALIDRHTQAATWHLAVRLEHQLGGNHLIRELCSLVLGARVHGLERLGTWAEGRLVSELEAQFASDGGHEERSPSYHLELLTCLTELRLLLGGDAPCAFDEALGRGLSFAASIEHGDGDVPQFHDSQLGVLPTRAQLSDLLSHTHHAADGLWHHKQTGYVIARLGSHHLVLDCGRFGAPTQPAHAHCSALSFELSSGTERLLVNRGTMAYGEGPPRRATRGTAFHNTLQLGGHEQAELWRGFRMGARGAAVVERLEFNRESALIEGAFAWPAPTHLTHRRRLILHKCGRLEVTDWLSTADGGPAGLGASAARVRFHVPESARLRWHSDGVELSEESVDLWPRIGEPVRGRLLLGRPREVAKQSSVIFEFGGSSDG